MAEFLAKDIPSCSQKRLHNIILTDEIILWLSSNFRKRSSNTSKRYEYIYRHSRHPLLKIKYRIGVEIYDPQDALEFKLRFM